MDNVQDIITEASKSDGQDVLATIIHIDGSAYRKAGAMMLFGENGLQMGMISGGCLEKDLAKRARILMQDADIHAKRISYDMTAEDDLGWGRGAGCNGVVHLLLEKVDIDLKMQINHIQTYHDKGLAVHLTKQITPTGPEGHKRYLGNDVESVDIKTSIHPNEHFSPETANMSEKAHQTVFTQVIKPKPRFIIFGAGMDVHPLAAMAHQTGFAVTVWDWRKPLLKRSFFPNATTICSTSITEAIKQADIKSGDYIAIMTHDFQKDKEIINHMLRIDGLVYLGILGPRRRTRRLLPNHMDSIAQYIHSPIGFSIGAEGPDEIAVSIIAELINIKNQKNHRTSDALARSIGWG